MRVHVIQRVPRHYETQLSAHRHQQQSLPQTFGRGLGPAPLRGAGAALKHGSGDGRERPLPAGGLQPGVQTLWAALAQALAKGSKRLLALLAYPDGCTRGETLFDPATGVPIVQVPPFSEEWLYAKEKPSPTSWRRSGGRDAAC